MLLVLGFRVEPLLGKGEKENTTDMINEYKNLFKIRFVRTFNSVIAKHSGNVQTLKYDRATKNEGRELEWYIPLTEKYSRPSLIPSTI